MTTSTKNSIINTIAAGALLFVGAIAPASADRVFPPNHLSPDAVFNTGTVSDQAVRDPWYFDAESDRRTSLKDNETHESSPYPSMYYFVNIRNHANDERAKLNEYRRTERQPDMRIADEDRIANDKS
jgi:hypothetical protein